MENEGSPIADGASLSNLSCADAAQSNGISVTGADDSLSLAIHTAVGPDGSPIGPHKVRFNAHQLSSLFKRYLDSRRRALQRQHGSCGSLSTAFVDQFSKHGYLLCERSARSVGNAFLLSSGCVLYRPK